MSRRAYGKFRKVINIRIGEDDFYRAAKCASAQGVSVSEYCRQLVRGAVVMGEKLQGTGFEEKVIEGFRELFGEELKKALLVHRKKEKLDIVHNDTGGA